MEAWDTEAVAALPQDAAVCIVGSGLSMADTVVNAALVAKPSDWTAESPTARTLRRLLRRLDPVDPVKYDFALCHTRMSGQCLDRRDRDVCAPCRLRPVCRHWRGRRGGRA